MLCNLCPRQCNALRTDTQGCGVCCMPNTPVLSRAALHFWEEPAISGTNGSGTVFFSGCSLHCVFCQNSDISYNNKGKAITINQLSDIFRKLENDGAHNINLVTPTHFANSIIKALDIYKPSIPIVYNSAGYESIETLKLLKDYVDIYLMDFKYIDSKKSTMYSKASDYPQICKAALLEVYSQQSKCEFNKENIMQKGVIVRHLLMPSATRDAIEIFDWVRTNLPNAYFSIMSQYIPLHKAKDMPVINRKITSREYNKVIDYIANSEFENCYIQERSSADENYIPNFDFTGIKPD
ncbi:MAG: radical SAM protein [Ruminococcaceae bacterium]|nr:radical SAM protein [Oscillospiraceae bacterium]